MPTIVDERYKQIYERLLSTEYPCTVVVYGPERTHRTRYRGEHEGCFAIEHCHNADDAWRAVDCGYPGWPGDLRVYTFPGDSYPESL